MKSTPADKFPFRLTVPEHHMLLKKTGKKLQSHCQLSGVVQHKEGVSTCTCSSEKYREAKNAFMAVEVSLERLFVPSFWDSLQESVSIRKPRRDILL